MMLGKNAAFDGVLMSPFADLVLQDWSRLPKGVRRPNDPIHPDEHQFYVLKVGFSLTQLLSTAEALEAVPVLLSTFRVGRRNEIRGIKSAVILRYHAENYYIRVQMLNDRVLALVDAVFHLLNATRAINSNTVLKNLKVERTAIPSAVKNLTKFSQKHTTIRNIIVHESSYDDPTLRSAELRAIIEAWDASRGPLPEHGSPAADHFREFSYLKRLEFIETNKMLDSKLTELLALLTPIYKREKADLLRKISEQ